MNKFKLKILSIISFLFIVLSVLMMFFLNSVLKIIGIVLLSATVTFVVCQLLVFLIQNKLEIISIENSSILFSRKIRILLFLIPLILYIVGTIILIINALVEQLVWLHIQLFLCGKIVISLKNKGISKLLIEKNS